MKLHVFFFYSFKFYPIWYRMHFYLNWAIITQMVYWYQFFNLSIANLFLYMIKDIPNLIYCTISKIIFTFIFFFIASLILHNSFSMHVNRLSILKSKY